MGIDFSILITSLLENILSGKYISATGVQGLNIN